MKKMGSKFLYNIFKDNFHGKNENIFQRDFCFRFKLQVMHKQTWSDGFWEMRILLYMPFY